MQITQTSITQTFFISLESLSYQELTVNLLWVKVCRIGCMTLEDVIAPSNYWKIWLTTVISITHFVIVVLVLCVWGCAIFRWWSKLVCTFLLILSKGKISKLTDHLWRQVGQVFRALVLKSGGSPSCYSLDLFSGALRVQLLGCSLFIADWSASYQLGFFKHCVYGRLLCLFPISLNWLFERTAITPSGNLVAQDLSWTPFVSCLLSTLKLFDSHAFVFLLMDECAFCFEKKDDAS